MIKSLENKIDTSNKVSNEVAFDDNTTKEN
jgi:hypothetical protein